MQQNLKTIQQKWHELNIKLSVKHRNGLVDTTYMNKAEVVIVQSITTMVSQKYYEIGFSITLHTNKTGHILLKSTMDCKLLEIHNVSLFI